MVLEGEEGNLEKVAMGNHEREKEGINKFSAQSNLVASHFKAHFFGFLNKN